MSDFLNGLVEVQNKSNRVSDSAVVRRKRILDAKRRMDAKRNGDASGINRVSDSARPATRGMVTKRSTVQGLTRKQDSASKSYLRLRQRIKDELSETETTQEATEAVLNVLDEMVQDNPQNVVNASEDIISAVFEVIGELVPDDGNEGGEGGEEGGEPEFDKDEEVSDSIRRRNVVRRRGVADARKLAMIRRRIKDGLEKRRAMSRRSTVNDSVVRRPSVAKRPTSVNDSAVRHSRALAAARRVRDARARREMARPSVRRAADSRMARRPISRKG